MGVGTLDIVETEALGTALMLELAGDMTDRVEAVGTENMEMVSGKQCEPV
jgi:hypothetical protein